MKMNLQWDAKISFVWTAPYDTFLQTSYYNLMEEYKHKKTSFYMSHSPVTYALQGPVHRVCFCFLKQRNEKMQRHQ